MANLDRISSEDVRPYRAHPNYSDDTAPRLRAFLASLRPLGGYVTGAWDMESCQRGRALVERLACSAEGEDLPKLHLSATECADVLSFMSLSEPISPETWWKDPKGLPSHLAGYTLLLNALVDSLRASRRRS